MRVKKVAFQALVVLGMALMGWASRAKAEISICNQWFCVETLSHDCDEWNELMDVCDQYCSSWAEIGCWDFDIPCAPEEVYVYCNTVPS